LARLETGRLAGDLGGQADNRPLGASSAARSHPSRSNRRYEGIMMRSYLSRHRDIHKNIPLLQTLLDRHVISYVPTSPPSVYKETSFQHFQHIIIEIQNRHLLQISSTGTSIFCNSEKTLLVSLNDYDAILVSLRTKSNGSVTQ
jgi:hypothetical protein